MLFLEKFEQYRFKVSQDMIFSIIEQKIVSFINWKFCNLYRYFPITPEYHNYNKILITIKYGYDKKLFDYNTNLREEYEEFLKKENLRFYIDNDSPDLFIYVDIIDFIKKESFIKSYLLNTFTEDDITKQVTDYIFRTAGNEKIEKVVDEIISENPNSKIIIPEFLKVKYAHLGKEDYGFFDVNENISNMGGEGETLVDDYLDYLENKLNIPFLNRFYDRCEINEIREPVFYPETSTFTFKFVFKIYGEYVKRGGNSDALNKVFDREFSGYGLKQDKVKITDKKGKDIYVYPKTIENDCLKLKLLIEKFALKGGTVLENSDFLMDPQENETSLIYKEDTYDVFDYLIEKDPEFYKKIPDEFKTKEFKEKWSHLGQDDYGMFDATNE